MKNLTNDQIQLIMTLFQLQNSGRDITDFVPDFHSFRYGFSKYKKIGDLILDNASLRAKEDSGGHAWYIFYYFGEDFRFSPVDGSIDKCESFDIVKHISFEDKI